MWYQKVNIAFGQKEQTKFVVKYILYVLISNVWKTLFEWKYLNIANIVHTGISTYPKYHWNGHRKFYTIDS